MATLTGLAFTLLAPDALAVPVMVTTARRVLTARTVSTLVTVLPGATELTRKHAVRPDRTAPAAAVITMFEGSRTHALTEPAAVRPVLAARIAIRIRWPLTTVRREAMRVAVRAAGVVVTVTDTVVVAVPVRSVMLTVEVADDAWAAVPLITPVAASRLSPAGRAGLTLKAAVPVRRTVGTALAMGVPTVAVIAPGYDTDALPKP